MSNIQHKFITNQEKFLSEIINGILPKSDLVDILVGYFYFSGYRAIEEQMQDKRVRILVGLDIDSQISTRVHEIDTFVKQRNKSRNQVRESYYEELVNLFNETDMLDNDKSIKSFAMFYGKIKDGTLEIRKTVDPCHAKMYLFGYNDLVNEGGEEPGTVITGSSNLSYQGLEGRIEINARFTDKASYHEGKEIFEMLWDTAVTIADKDTMPDFEVKVIKKVWYENLYKPYLMYVRVLHEYFTIPTKDNMLTPHDITNGRFYNLKYQTDAVQLALNAIENHNGAIVADVVGLGKSIIGSTVAKNLCLSCIIIAPPHLTQQWEDYKTQFHFEGTVFSSGSIEEALNHYKRNVHDGEKYLIIVDEAHRYRNEYTEDYANLHDLCQGNKVLLLTATPFNNRPDDIFSMLKLFQIPSASTLNTVDNLGTAFRELMLEYKKLNEAKRKEKITEVEATRKAEEIARMIRSIISPLVIRRSRIDLKMIPEYAEDLKRQKIELVIPEDPVALSYDLSGLEEVYLDTLNTINPQEEDKKKKSESDIKKDFFKAARYSPVLYVKKDMVEAFSKELESKTGITYNLLLGRQGNMSKFMRRLLVSRFESSVAAFKSSLEYMIDSSERVLKWIETSQKIPIYKKGHLPDVDTFYQSTDDGMKEIDEEFEKYTKRGFYEIDMKYINDSFVTDVKKDIKLLKNIQKNWFGEERKITKDPKLESFKEIIAQKLKKEPNRKLIVFTEYADTANYLSENLKDFPVFKYTSADAKSKNKETIVTNFDAGLPKEKQEDDYKILVATDAISEGYNLHRAGAIINYDIPYNPTRVIQRIGRINRVNKKVFDKLYIYNYFPSSIGEKETRTKEISTLKMAMIHAIMGEDTKVLTKDEEVQAFFVDQYRKELAKSEVASWDSEYRMLLDSLKGTDLYKEALAIPHRARTGRKIEKEAEGVLVMGKRGNDYVFKIGDKNYPSYSLSAEDALSLFKAEEDEKPVALTKDFDEVYQSLKQYLFRKQEQSEREKNLLKALQKIKVMIKEEALNLDYLKDLERVVKADGLSGYEVRLINTIKPTKYESLLKEIPQDYLDRIIATENKIEEGEETLILTEEITK